jgi:hypothetical protein
MNVLPCQRKWELYFPLLNSHKIFVGKPYLVLYYAETYITGKYFGIEKIKAFWFCIVAMGWDYVSVKLGC